MKNSLIQQDVRDSVSQKDYAEVYKPNFPKLSNNTKRKEFLQGFHNWLVWLNIPEIDETYYRYNLPDGSSIVACEYKVWQEWRAKYENENPETTGVRWYLLEKGYHHFNDCKSSESQIVEKLKEINKMESK